MLADCLNILCLSEVRLSHHEQAIEYARRCYELDKASGDAERISMSLNTLAGIYISAKLPREAEPYVLRGLKEAQESGIASRIAICQGMACEMYHALHEDEKAVDFASQALRTEEQLGRPHKAAIRRSQRAAALNSLKRYDEALADLRLAIGFFRSHPEGMKESLAISLTGLGQTFAGMNMPDSATHAYREAAALFTALGDLRGEMHACSGLYEMLWNTHPKEAHDALMRFNLLRDSLYDLHSAESLARYNAEFGNDILRQEAQEQLQVSRRRLTLILTAICLLAAVCAAGFFLYRRRNTRRILELLDELKSDRIPQSDSLDSSEEGLLDEIRSAVRRLMPGGKLTTSGVANELHLTPATFARRIKALTGLTPSNFILTIRMEEARRLLALYPKYNVGEVATRCGFADTSHFSHAFQRLFGQSPTDFVKEQKSAISSENSCP